MSNFHVGQKVVCVDDSRTIFSSHENFPSQLQKGEVYTIAGFTLGNSGLGVGVTLVEVVPEYPRFAWMQSRFRPVRTTSIEIFQKMLAPVPRKEFADT